MKIEINKANFPQLFPYSLEYNAPVHVGWNIVHIASTIPDSIQIYLCAQNCMRGVVMTAYEMNIQDRFACVLIKPQDLETNLEELMITQISHIIKEKNYPKHIVLFPVCLHKFLNIDLNYIYKVLRQTFTNLSFIEAFMDPISQKEGIPPDIRLRTHMYDPLQINPSKIKGINILGSEVSHIHSDLIEYANIHHLPINQIDQYESIPNYSLNINTFFPGKYAIEQLSKRLNQDFFYFSPSYNMNDYDLYIKQLDDYFHVHTSYNKKEEVMSCYLKLKELIQDTPICIDQVFTTRPLSLARFLLQFNFNITRLYLDTCLIEEKEDFEYLKNYPITIYSTIHMTSFNQIEDYPCLAFGGKAAYFTKTKHYINLIEGGGYFGYEGLLKLGSVIKEAYLKEKEAKEELPLKGLGCECAL